jgi:hypothetical protein
MKDLKRALCVLVVAVTAAVAGLTTLMAATPSTPVSALCVANPIAGNWRNIDSSTRSVTRVVVSEGCDDVRLCTESGCTGGTGAFYDIAVFGKCSPTDCVWGTRRLADAGGGWYRTTYNFGFKTSDVWIKTYPYYGRTYLRVWVYNDFTPADGRTDYTTDEWFLP